MNILQTPVNTVVSTRKKQWGKVILCYTELQCVCFRNFNWSRLNPGKHETAGVSGGECEGIVGNDSHLRIDSAAAAKSLQSCPTVRPPRRQPTRLPRPWDSPGKNTGVGCHFLLQCMKMKSESEVAQSCLTFCHPMDCSPPGSSVHGIFQARVLEWGAIAFSGG